MSIHTFKKEFLGEFGDFEVFHAEKGTLTNSVFPSNENPAGWYWKTVSDAFSLPGEAVGPPCMPALCCGSDPLCASPRKRPGCPRASRAGDRCGRSSGGSAAASVSRVAGRCVRR